MSSVDKRQNYAPAEGGKKADSTKRKSKGDSGDAASRREDSDVERSGRLRRGSEPRTPSHGREPQKVVFHPSGPACALSYLPEAPTRVCPIK